MSRTAGPHAAATRLATWTGVVLGVALMGALDEIVFHQLLQWHHFYVHTTEFWRIFSDGLFHALTTAMWFVGAALLWTQRRALAAVLGGWYFWGGYLLGMGAFQTFDGIINHKVLQLHPVRLGVENILPYDAAWITAGIALLALGWLVLRRGKRQS